VNIPSFVPHHNASPPPSESDIPPGVPEDWKRESRKFRPHWKKVLDWLAHTGRVVTICVSICTGTIAIHGYVKALELKDFVRDAVVEVVAETDVETRARLQILETRMAGVPEWRGTTTELDHHQDYRLQELERRANNCEQQQAFSALVAKRR
jgi:hypothetical protein